MSWKPLSQGKSSSLSQLWAWPALLLPDLLRAPLRESVVLAQLRGSQGPWVAEKGAASSGSPAEAEDFY